jgi:hypothetical protein
VRPTLVTALRIAHALGTSVNQVFYLEDDDPARSDHPAAAIERQRPGPERALPRQHRQRPLVLEASRG